MRVIFRLLSPLFFLATTASAQVSDSIVKVDDIVTVLKLKKKGVMPYGFKAGAAMQDIKTAMGKAEVFKEDSSYITYTLYFSNDKYDFGDITFDFENGKLIDASVETYFGKEEPAVKALNLIKLNFDKLYKPGEYSDKTLRWKYAKKKASLLWIQMSEIEFEDDNGFVIDFYSNEPKE